MVCTPTTHKEGPRSWVLTIYTNHPEKLEVVGEQTATKYNPNHAEQSKENGKNCIPQILAHVFWTSQTGMAWTICFSNMNFWIFHVNGNVPPYQAWLRAHLVNKYIDNLLVILRLYTPAHLK